MITYADIYNANEQIQDDLGLHRALDAYADAATIDACALVQSTMEGLLEKYAGDRTVCPSCNRGFVGDLRCGCADAPDAPDAPEFPMSQEAYKAMGLQNQCPVCGSQRDIEGESFIHCVGHESGEQYITQEVYCGNCHNTFVDKYTLDGYRLQQ